MNEYRLGKFEGTIFLCGFMASGKSTIGEKLAQRLNRPFMDLDHYLVEKEGRSIKEIFDTDGESYFREKEWEYLLELTQSFKGVLALGGGALHNQNVVDHLKLYGLLVYLNTPLEVVVERVSRNQKRPIVLDAEGKIKTRETLFRELKTLYLARKELYEQAQVQIDCDGAQSIESKVNIVIEKIKRYV